MTEPKENNSAQRNSIQRSSTQRNCALTAIDEIAQGWFLLLTSGEATRGDDRRFRAWCAEDPRHRTAFAEVSKLWGDMEDLRADFAPPAGLSIGQPTSKPETPDLPGGKVVSLSQRRRRWRRPVTWGGLAAACMAFLVLVGPDVSTRWGADHATKVGEQARVTLPDGSTAWLNTDTAIDVQYENDRRQVVLLQGEAQFTVARDPERPFAVVAQDGRAQALGTVYSVRDLGSQAIVTVSEGRVEVSSPLNDRAAAVGRETGRVVLTAGQQLLYQRGAPPGPVRNVDLAAVQAWQKGFVVIRDLPLTQALAEIDRYRPGKIVLLADTANLQPVTARLSIKGIDDGLRALAATHGLQVTRVTDYLVLLR